MQWRQREMTFSAKIGFSLSCSNACIRIKKRVDKTALRFALSKILSKIPLKYLTMKEHKVIYSSGLKSSSGEGLLVANSAFSSFVVTNLNKV